MINTPCSDKDISAAKSTSEHTIHLDHVVGKLWLNPERNMWVLNSGQLQIIS